jgi:AmmeMemoRadiSam system protein B
LRPGLQAVPSGLDDYYVLFDSNRISPERATLSRGALEVIQFFDGSRTLDELRQAFDSAIPLEELAGMAAQLDEFLFLDSPAFGEYLTGPTRRPSCIGCYPNEPAAIRKTLKQLFTAPGGPGLPSASPAPRGRLRAALLPHMDYARGGVTYGWGFKELVEQTDAKLFVVIATSHYSPHRFTLTRMNFASPLGVVETDQAYVDRLEQHYGDGLFDDPFAHLPEHSIELEVVLLQYLLEKRGPFKIVPLLVGSFRDCVRAETDPSQADDIARMVAALRAAEAAAGEPVCYLISGDLAHIGPKFGDPDPVSEAQLKVSRERDDAILKQLSVADPAGYFGVIAEERDERRICGLPPTWLTLAAAQPRTGRVLHYGRHVAADGHESVSFAAAAFYE